MNSSESEWERLEDVTGWLDIDPSQINPISKEPKGTYSTRHYLDKIDELTKGESKSAFDIQEGGNHYKKYAIQPTEYCQRNNLNTCESNVVKYITRHRDKNGIEDLKKAKHYIELLIELEYK